MNKEMIAAISDEIISPITINKIAEEICSGFEKQAGGGLKAFGEALTGSKAKRLRGEVEELSEKMLQHSNNPKLKKTLDEVDNAKKMISNSSVHERMDSVRQNLDRKMDNYKRTVAGNDDVLNYYTGIRKPLKTVSPSYMKAKAENFGAKMGVRNAKSKYSSQKKRLEKDLYGELDYANHKFSDVKKELNIDGLHENLLNKNNEYEKALSATKSARGVASTAAIGAGVGSAYLYNKNKQKNSTGQYYMGDDYRMAELDTDMIEKIADEIIQGMFK